MITILCSGVGLGIYLPSLIIQRRLSGLGVSAELEVLEDHYTPERREGHLAHKKAHHDDFALAQLAHRMARDVQGCLDDGRIAGLLRRWAAEGRRDFVVWSGFWLPVLQRYDALTGRASRLDFCRIDAEISASFKVHQELPMKGREIWLWNWAQKRLAFEVPVTAEPPLDWDRRDAQLVVHGGGWGIGTYQQRVLELMKTPWSLGVVVHDKAEATHLRPTDTAYTIEVGWHPWMRDAGGHHRFPPFSEVGQAEAGDRHALYELIRHSRAIVSKPGGGTLIDSLSSATPVVLLEPYGYAEKANGLLWEHLGFGLTWDTWRAEGFSSEALEVRHQKLLSRGEHGPEYAAELASRTECGS